MIRSAPPIADLQATEARLKADGWGENNLRWWRRSAYAEAGLPQPVTTTAAAHSRATTSTRPAETGAEWARRLLGKEA